MLFRRLAVQDLEAIWRYTGQDSPQAADRQLERFEDAAQRLAEFPRIGASKDYLRRGLRSRPVGEYLILYTEIEGGVRISRVLHGRRDLRHLV